MPGPGIYARDATEGITRVEDLPAPRVIERSRNYPSRSCPECGRSAGRLRTARRTLHDLGDPVAGRPRDLRLTYSQHRCRHCGHYFNADMLDLAVPNGHYTHRVVATAVRCVVEDGLPYRTASWHLWRDHRVFVPWATIQNWVEAAGEKRRPAGRARVPRRRVGGVLRVHRRR
jgi:ribosomal protein S14